MSDLDSLKSAADRIRRRSQGLELRRLAEVVIQLCDELAETRRIAEQALAATGEAGNADGE